MTQVDLQVPGTARTSNELWFDALIRHQIGLLRTAGSTRKKIIGLLDATEKDLRNAIRRRLRNAPPGLDTPAKVVRLRVLLADIRTIRRDAHREVASVLLADMKALALAEPAFLAAAMQTVVPVLITPNLPAPELLRSIVTTRPFEGDVLSGWARKLARADIDRIEAQIAIGLTQGETVQEISRRVVGTVALRGRNGVTQITRRNAEAIVLTATNAIANQAKREFYLANATLIDIVLYVATLDAVTTAVCRGLDGKRFKIGKGPIPPLHVRCRSLRIALLDADPLGKRPMKPVTERGLLREFARREGFDAPTTRAGLPRGTKGAFDSFARRRTRELIGRVPAKVSYQEWLGRQSAMFQNDVLGRTKGRLFRRGGLKLDRFVDAAGNEKTLAELAASDARAFRAAGLDPRDFL